MQISEKALHAQWDNLHAQFHHMVDTHLEKSGATFMPQMSQGSTQSYRNLSDLFWKSAEYLDGDKKTAPNARVKAANLLVQAEKELIQFARIIHHTASINTLLAIVICAFSCCVVNSTQYVNTRVLGIDEY